MRKNDIASVSYGFYFFLQCHIIASFKFLVAIPDPSGATSHSPKKPPDSREQCI